MNTIKMTLLSFRKNLFTFILIIVELAVLFLAENYMVSVLGEREMLRVPFKSTMNERTAFVYDSEYSKNAAFLGITDTKASRELLLSDIKDSYKIYDVMYFTNGNYTVYSVNDDIFNSMVMPLAFGSYGNAVGSFGTSIGENIIVFPDETTLTLTISGSLTETTYIPAMLNFSSQDMTVNDFYYTSVNERDIILTNRSSISGFENYFSGSIGFLIEFENNAATNIEALKDKTLTVSMLEIAENTNKALQKDLFVFMPLVGTVLLIIIIGVVCISVIIFKESERKNGILWLCGFSKRRIISVHCSNILFAIILAFGISAAAFAVLKLLGSDFVTGITFTATNLIVSVLTSIVLIGFSAIIPEIKCRKTSPIEYLRRTL